MCAHTAADLHKISCGATGRVFALPSCYAQLKITIEMYVDVVASAVAATVRFSLLPLLLLLFLLRSSFALRTTRSSGKRASSSLPLIPKKLERSTSSYSNTIHTHTHKHWHKYTPASAPSHTIAYKFTYAHSAGHQVPFRMSKSSEIKKGIPRK